ncbi:MAG: YraN family protein [Candidatus Omnitrophica bacterium]|nr:YraN family protein [Candidatus Omnitrophota bacterium]
MSSLTNRWPWPARKSPPARQQLGAHAEALAQRFLCLHGYTIEATNVRFPVGELDVVAWDGQTLCFVEVRSASSDAWGGPLASITDRKRQRLIRAARWYLKRLNALPEEIRFDVVAVDWSGPDAPHLELVRSAFEVD